MRWLLGADPADPLVALRCDFWGFNSIGLFDGDEALVVDPGIKPEEIETLRARLAAGGAQVTTVVLTHSHHDHIRGWQRFPGAEVHFPRVAAEKSEDARSRILAAKLRIDEELGVRDPEFAYPEGTAVFDDRRDLRIGGLDVELLFLPGHSDCTSVVRIPALKALATADYLVSPGLPYCRWRAREFEAAIRRMTTWVEDGLVERVVPAHGRVIEGREALLTALGEESSYFEFARSEVRAELSSGSSQELVARRVASRLGERRGVDLGPRAAQDVDNVRRILAEEA